MKRTFCGSLVDTVNVNRIHRRVHGRSRCSFSRCRFPLTNGPCQRGPSEKPIDHRYCGVMRDQVLIARWTRAVRDRRAALGGYGASEILCELSVVDAGGWIREATHSPCRGVEERERRRRMLEPVAAAARSKIAARRARKVSLSTSSGCNTCKFKFRSSCHQKGIFVQDVDFGHSQMS